MTKYNLVFFFSSRAVTFLLEIFLGHQNSTRLWTRQLCLAVPAGMSFP